MDIYAIGDIHGYSDKLISLVGNLPLKDDDLLVFLGDYVDRGPDSRGVIEYLIKLKKERKCVFIKGNHEVMMLVGLTNFIDKQLWKGAGGRKTIASYKGRLRLIPRSHLDFLRTCKYTFETEDCFFSHAGCDPKKRIEDHVPDDYIWLREEFLMAPVLPIKKLVVHGHTPRHELLSPFDGTDRLCCDNGVYYDRPLLAIRLADRKFFYSSI